MAARRARGAFAAMAVAALLVLSTGCEQPVDQVDVRDSIHAWEAAQED